MKHLVIEFSEKQMLNYFKKNNLKVKKGKHIKVFFNTNEETLRKRANNVRCGIEHTITNDGANPELLNIRIASNEEIKAENIRITKLNDAWENVLAEREDAKNEEINMRYAENRIINKYILNANNQ